MNGRVVAEIASRLGGVTRSEMEIAREIAREITRLGRRRGRRVTWREVEIAAAIMEARGYRITRKAML